MLPISQYCIDGTMVKSKPTDSFYPLPFTTFCAKSSYNISGEESNASQYEKSTTECGPPMNE